MTTWLCTRRDFSVQLASWLPVLGFAGTSLATVAKAAPDEWNPGISRTAESLHQEVAFKASRQRIYDALMDERQFSKLSGGLAAQITREAGGAFSLFGNQIKGRHIELTPNERIVQVWRSEGWKPHVYSIARFELQEDGSGTKLVFDHTAFPVGQAEHLATGWKSNYWDALQRYLA